MSEIVKTKSKLTIPTAEQFDLDRAMDSLYHVCLQYFTTLKIQKHPMINLIIVVMDLLIELKKDNTLDDKTRKQAFDDIHSVAYKNIESIYDYDKEQTEKNKVEIIPDAIDDTIDDATNSNKLIL